MSELKHTQEPWFRSITYGGIVGDNRKKVAQATYHRQSDAEQSNADANRIIACVNACAGMVDPAKEIATLRAEVERLKKAEMNNSDIAIDQSRKRQKSEAEVLRLRELIEWVTNTQKRNYGHATDLHIDMLDWPRKINALANGTGQASS